jgi:hypothetical protein
MKKLYQITILKGKRTDSLVERLDKYGPEIAENTWECNLTEEQVEQIRRIYVRPGNNMVEIEPIEPAV